ARGNDRSVLAALHDAPGGSLAIHNHPSGVLDPSPADLRVASDFYAHGVGFAITDNEARELYVLVEPVPPRPVERLDEEQIDRLLAPGGAIERWHPAYEDRPTQRDLAASVAQAFNDGGIVLAEAGTGTGKSVAYLIPAIQWAVQNSERTVVSTNTINLQEQLVRKDLPLLKRALGADFRFALVKGRSNYISIRRARLAAQSQALLFDDPQQRSLSAILEWIDTTEDGSLQDLPFAPPAEVWDEVASDSDVCLRAKCPHFEQCFYQKARREAVGAQVLVANHHLLFSDLAVRKAQQNYTAAIVLPPYRRVVLDEAHNVEDAATEHLGASISRRGVLRLLNRLERRGKGLLPAIESKLRAADHDLLQEEALRSIGDELRPLVERARVGSVELFGLLDQLLVNTEDGIVRLTDDFICSPLWIRGLDTQHHNVLIALEKLAKGIESLRGTIIVDRRWSELLHEQLVELNGVLNRLAAAVDALHVCFAAGDDSVVRWLERRSQSIGEANVTARAAPVDLSEVMRDSLFDRVETAVLTSATLATRDGFDFVRRRLGIGGGLRVREEVHASPFDFASQTVVAVPNDLPVPGTGENPRFDDATAGAIADLTAVTGGGLFALFTSYRSLRSVAAELRRRGLQNRWPLFVQGEGARTRLLESFVSSGCGVLLGVSSFWEGVDVPGDPLRGIVIAKLPFKVPTEPLTAARIEAIEKNGGNSFLHYVLPHAALRLKQGFGRLVRSKNDRGAVVLLDRRVLEKGYGRYFLESLPPAPVLKGSWSQLRLELASFYPAPRSGVLA
ncbi:MAG TPA: helicase C-terminal domain-containing protein, partial [Longimicrobiales bacterium]|nr:helicase C-terminal domain-containing protein [Longimicrobiales bacterium]